MPVIIEGITFYTTTEAAEYTGKSANTIKQAIREKELSGIAVTNRLYLIKQDDLDGFKATVKPVGRPKKVSEAK